jgi:hypothetical protein
VRVCTPQMYTMTSVQMCRGRGQQEPGREDGVSVSIAAGSHRYPLLLGMWSGYMFGVARSFDSGWPDSRAFLLEMNAPCSNGGCRLMYVTSNISKIWNMHLLATLHASLIDR